MFGEREMEKEDSKVLFLEKEDEVFLQLSLPESRRNIYSSSNPPSLSFSHSSLFPYLALIKLIFAIISSVIGLYK